ncbi:MAG: c-type cytochrome [Betaproteobacteria bacterium]
MVLANLRASAGVLAATVMLASLAAAADRDSAHELAQESNCYKCHSIKAKKDGPSWREVTDKNKGKPDAESRLLKYVVSTTEKAKFADGHSEDHPPVKSKDEAKIRNLVQWLLSQ